MSHFTRIKTRMVEREYLLRALRDLGCVYEEGLVAVRGYAGQRTPVDIRVSTGDPDCDLGFREVGGVYECVADWGGMRAGKAGAVFRRCAQALRRWAGNSEPDWDPDVFLPRLTQRYAYHATCAKLAEQGFSLAQEEKTPDGRIRLVLRRTD